MCIGTGAIASITRAITIAFSALERTLFAPLVWVRYARRGSVVPFLRYFIFVGGALVALLFAADWVWPSAPSAPAQQASTESPVEQTIRIRSARRWPDRIDFDTTQPTIVPPAPLVAEAPPPAPPTPVVADNSALDAHAELKPPAKPAPAPKRQARARHHNYYAQQQQPQPDFWGRPPTFASAGPSWTFGRW